jgi:hypothetical protein
MTKREQHQLEVADRRWKRIMRPFDQWWAKAWKNSMKFLDSAVNWYFFFDKKKSKGDKAYHVLLWIFVTWVIFRVLGL